MSATGIPDPDPLRDPLTGLAGVDAVRARIEQWLSEGARSGTGATVHALLLGLRRFDALNLAYGAPAGDAALGEVAARMSHFAGAELEGPWSLARGNGGNFLLVANEACSRER
jgi:GGDEF domain-containing protein